MQDERAAGPRRSPYVAVSEIEVAEQRGPELIEAFRQRLGEVDRWPGFQGLEVWRDRGDPTRFLMVSWWDDHESFVAYLRSDAHRRSHARIPGGRGGPRPAGLSRFDVVAH